MKLRHTLLLAIIIILLSACSFSLAQDVTPPPDYVPPTPAATLGPLFPASAPDISNGAAIYVEKCAACHGNSGLGDGEQGKQLPVKVAPLGLADFAKAALPAAWYTEVTQGNLDRFMPPFTSLTDQERWNVISYALTLHTKPDQIETGKLLFEKACTDCSKKFSSLETMSGLSENDLVKIIKEGKGDIPAFGKDFSNDEALAVAMYLRTLTFATLPSTPTTASAIETPVSVEAGTPSAGAAPVNGTQVSGSQKGKVSGSIQNQSGSALPSDIKVTLSGLEHGSDPTTGLQEITTLEGNINADGTFVFENMDIPENRIYMAKVTVDGLTYQSGYGVVKAGMTQLTLAPIILYPTTEDSSALKIDTVQIFFDFANADTVQIFAVYSITNASDKTILVNIGDKKVVPFIAPPKGAESLGYEATQETAPFVQTDKGFAMPPSKTPYGLIAFASIPKEKELAISQPALMPIDSLSLFLPEGITAQGKTLTDKGMQAMQSMNFHVYSANGLAIGESLDFILTGKPETTAVNPDITQNKSLLIGVGTFGIVLILAGAWMFIRDRRTRDEETNNEKNDELDDSESLMDAIIALDDLHRAGKLSDKAYQTRRNELKSALKRKI